MLEVLTADDTSSDASGDNTTSDTSGDVLTANTTSDVSGDTATNTALPYDIERPSNIRALNFLIKKLIISSCEYVSQTIKQGLNAVTIIIENP